MPRALSISGEYPPDWKEISNATWAAAGHRCIRCQHPYRKGENGKGEWTACDERCSHRGPVAVLFWDGKLGNVIDAPAGQWVADLVRDKTPHCIVVAQWRIGTVHHLDGNKANCVWWNLLALCQRCHLTIQSRVNPQQPYMLEHSDWFKPYVAGFYAKKYEGRDIAREEAILRLDQLLAYECVINHEKL